MMMSRVHTDEGIDALLVFVAVFICNLQYNH